MVVVCLSVWLPGGYGFCFSSAGCLFCRLDCFGFEVLGFTLLVVFGFLWFWVSVVLIY